VVQRRWWPTATEIAVDVRDALDADDEDLALRLLLDGINQLPTAAAANALAEALPEPPSTGSIRWDTLLAAAIRYRLHTMGEKAPRWTHKEPLDRFWWPVSINASKAYNDMAHTPAELVRVGIFMDERGFSAA
jgi:hypothetical protein